MSAGVDRDVAVSPINSMMLSTEATFMELYRRGCISAEANAPRRRESTLNIPTLLWDHHHVLRSAFGTST